MEVNHFSHEHPLILQEEHKDNGDKVSCNGCFQPIITTAPACNCNHCVFFLHKVCAELPLHIQHPLHPEHGLNLLAKPAYLSQACLCEICYLNDWKGFSYNCSLCKFDIDIVCALKSQTIENTRHEHPLIPIHKPALFLCHGCSSKHQGISYQCTICKFWINQKCASLPSTIKRSDHEHPLSLLYSYSVKDYRYKSYCEICGKRLIKGYWAYQCERCIYFGHVCCTISKIEPFRDQNTVEDPDPNLIHLPMPDGLTVDLISHFVKKIKLEENNKASELNHFSHHHPLVLSDKQITNESCSESELPINQIKNVTERCKACLLAISAPFYRCSQCTFSLHPSCAELPNEIQDQFHHEHPLTLLPKSSSSSDILQCNGCHKFCDGFVFHCPECQVFLDVHCASLPPAIKHEAHRHTLILKKTSEDRCNACDGTFPGFIYVCEICNYNIHPLCAQFPRRITHRYDPHSFSLTYFPVKDHSDEYICEFCEEDINPKTWFYHCVDCDQSAHAMCFARLTMNIQLPWLGTTL